MLVSGIKASGRLFILDCAREKLGKGKTSPFALPAPAPMAHTNPNCSRRDDFGFAAERRNQSGCGSRGGVRSSPPAPFIFLLYGLGINPILCPGPALAAAAPALTRLSPGMPRSLQLPWARPPRIRGVGASRGCCQGGSTADVSPRAGATRPLQTGPARRFFPGFILQPPVLFFCPFKRLFHSRGFPL